MIKNSLIFVVTTTLAMSVIAGGDDRDMGPIESLESLETMEKTGHSLTHSLESLETMKKTESLSQRSLENSLEDSPEVLETMKKAEGSLQHSAEVLETMKKAEGSLQHSAEALETMKKTEHLSQHSLETMVLSSEVSVGNQVTKTRVEKLKLTIADKAATVACQDKFGLKASNIAIFRKAILAGNLYNTGPIEDQGTVFSPKRWDVYFNCIAKNDG